MNRQSLAGGQAALHKTNSLEHNETSSQVFNLVLIDVYGAVYRSLHL